MDLEICIIFFISINFSNFVFSRQLLQIQTLIRHGERSPCFSYPSDPYKHIFNKGLGQLTDKGITQLKEVGFFLRQYYHEFLPTNFHKKEIYIKSSDTDRTITSALAAMSTLFPNEIIPVHTVPKSYDFLLKMTSICPYHKKLLSKEFKLEKYRTLFTEYESFFKELEEGTGLLKVDIHLALRICDVITVWHQLNLEFPTWLNAESISKCVKLGNMKFVISYSNRLLTKFRGGPLAINIVDSMIKRAKSFQEDQTGLKMVGFFAHDSTISALLSHIESFNQMKPPLASSVIFELYYDSSEPIKNNDPLSQFFVRLLFRNDSSLPPYTLNISTCHDVMNPSHTDCRLDVFHYRLQEHALNDLPRECGLVNIIDYWFASSDQIKLYDNSLAINDGELKSIIPKSKFESDLLVNILVPLLLVEIFVFFLFYRIFRR